MARVLGRMGTLKTGVGALAVAVVALLVLLFIELSSSGSRASAADDQRSVARSAALQEAIDQAPTLFSYDYRRLDKDLAAARAVTTGEFTSQYDQVSVPAVKPLAAKYKVVVKAKVLGASVVDDAKAADPKSAQVKVLLFLDQTVENTQLSAPRVDANRTVLTMQKVGAGWKVAGVDAI